MGDPLKDWVDGWSCFDKPVLAVSVFIFWTGSESAKERYRRDAKGGRFRFPSIFFVLYWCSESRSDSQLNQSN